MELAVIVALVLSGAALAVALVALRDSRARSQAPCRPCDHGYEVVGVKAGDDGVVFDLRCVVCGARSSRTMTEESVSGLARSMRCSLDEARKAIMASGGDLAEAERRLLGE